MNRSTLRKILSAGAVLAMALASSSAFAQATRTWVSGVGDDVNPCSRTAPCKTFAGAISKTAENGEISVLDPGGFGAVTITKSITIDGAGVIGSILSSLTTGIIVNAGAGDVVVIRNVSIDGAGNGLYGIRFIGSGAALHVENVTIFGIAGKGILFAPTGAAELFVTNTTVQRNLNAGSGGILIAPTGGGAASAILDNVRLEGNQYGLRVEGNSDVVASHCTFSGNVNNGALVISPTLPSTLALTGCTLSGNGSDPTSAGIKSEGAAATARLSDNDIIGNTVGLLVASGGKIISFGNNRVGGNAVDGSPTSTVTSR